MLSTVDKSSSGKLTFDQFLQIVEEQKNRKQSFSSTSEEDWINAFIACGADDKGGVVDKDRLMHIVRTDFGLQADLDDHDQDQDLDLEEGFGTESTRTENTSGKLLQFEEFMKLLSS